MNARAARSVHPTPALPVGRRETLSFETPARAPLALAPEGGAIGLGFNEASLPASGTRWRRLRRPTLRFQTPNFGPATGATSNAPARAELAAVRSEPPPASEQGATTGAGLALRSMFVNYAMESEGLHAQLAELAQLIPGRCEGPVLRALAQRMLLEMHDWASEHLAWALARAHGDAADTATPRPSAAMFAVLSEVIDAAAEEASFSLDVEPVVTALQALEIRVSRMIRLGHLTPSTPASPLPETA